jgi:hypothetical protein
MTNEERQIFITELMLAFHEAEPKLSDEETRWVRNAIARQEQQLKFRAAVIEKSLAGVIWMILLGIGAVFLEYAKNHGFKP